jgi:hypothetical protein
MLQAKLFKRAKVRWPLAVPSSWDGVVRDNAGRVSRCSGNKHGRLWWEMQARANCAVQPAVGGGWRTLPVMRWYMSSTSSTVVSKCVVAS